MAITLGDLDFNSLTNFGATMDLSLDVASDDDFIVARVGGEIGTLTSVVLDPGGSDEATFSTAVEKWHTIDTDLVANVMYLRAADVPAAGTYTVRLTVNAGADCGFSVRALKGVKDEAPEATASGESTNTAVIQTEITTLTDDAWIFDSVVNSQETDPTSWTPDSGQTEEYDIFASGHTEAGSYESKATAGAETQGWTNVRTNRNQCHALVSLAPASGATVHSGACSMTGSGTVTVAETMIKPGASSMTGAGTVTAAASMIKPGVVSMTGSGVLTSAAAIYMSGVCSMTGAGVVTVAETMIKPGVVSMTGSGTLTVASSAIRPGVCAMTGTGVLTATGVVPSTATYAILTDFSVSTATLSSVSVSIAQLDNVSVDYAELTTVSVEI